MWKYRISFPLYVIVCFQWINYNTTNFAEEIKQRTDGKGVDVLLARYPHLKGIPIITTCSTEVIGDDVDGVIRKLNEGLLKEKYPDREVHLITIHTPSFVGSMISGYDVAVRDFVRHFATRNEDGGKNGKLNLITGWVNPGDVKALKHLVGAMDIDATVLFEIESFDSPMMPDGSEVSHGGTTMDDLRSTANAIGTIALGLVMRNQTTAFQHGRHHFGERQSGGFGFESFDNAHEGSERSAGLARDVRYCLIKT